jgi:molybdate transport system ATP-binding protein
VSRLSVSCQHQFPTGIELDVEFATEHRTIALFGPSGAGKTSTLMAIAGFLSPDTGRICWGERLLFDSSASISVAPDKRNLGVVFQDQRLFPHLSVERNLRYGQRRRHGSGEAPDFDRIIKVLDLQELLARDPTTLSGGESQRLALGRALLSTPELLLMDEPVAAVDESRRGTILGYVDRIIHEWNLPALYVSHHRAEVQRLADWVIAFEEGRVVQAGAPEEVLGATGLAGSDGEPVNLLRLVRPVLSVDGAWLARVPGTKGEVAVRLPRLDAEPQDPTYVQFAASDVMLARGEVAKLSARNRFPARIEELVPRHGHIFAALSVADQRLWAEVTDDAVQDLGLVPGIEVVCLVKTAALQLLD